MFVGSTELARVRSIIVFALILGISAAGGVTTSGQDAVPAFTGLTPGFIDAGFKPVLGGNVGLGAPGNRTIVLPDGKILVAGSFHLANGVSKNGIARFNPDGTVDATFNTKSGAAGGAITALAVQSNGKILIGGAFSSYAGQAVGSIARLDANGNFDATFNNAGGIGNAPGVVGTVADISVLPDDRIYITGAFTTYNGTTINRLARLNVNGALDTTFAVGTGLTGSPANVIEQAPGGKIIISGFFTAYNGTTVPRIARINSDGSLDTTFAPGTGPVGAASVIKVLPDNKILVGGGGATFNGVARNGLVRLNPDGDVDTTFDAAITGSTAITAIARQSDGKFIISGPFTAVAATPRVGIARIGVDGALDTTFDPGTGFNAAASARGIALQTDGRAVLVGTFTSYSGTTRNGMAIVNANGSLDTTAVTGLAQRGELFTAAIQADGKILVGGFMSSVGGIPRANIARLNADGSNDATFNPGTGANDTVNAIAVQQDGKIIISGEFLQYNGTAISRIARLNTDGSIDTSFNVGTGLGGTGFGLAGNSIAIQSDGKVLVGGGFTSYNGAAVGRLVRLNTDGSLDSSFNTGVGAANTVFKIVVQSDGKIVIGGDFITFNTVASSRMARLNADGTIDTSFTLGAGFGGRVKDLAVQTDGKIVAVGGFTTFNAIPRVRAARLNSNGTLDTTFDVGVGFPNEVAAIQPLPDGKYLVVGNTFVTALGLPRNRIVRLRSNGSLDPKFVSGFGPVGQAAALRFILPHNGKYFIGGTFDTFNTSARTSIVLISNTTKAPVDFDGDGKTDFSIARHYGGIGPWTYWINFSTGAPFATFDFGIFAVDSLQPGDYDGDGITDVAIWRGPNNVEPSGYWIVLSTTNSVKYVPFGLPGDRAVVEDYDGDGKDDMSVWRQPGPTTIGQGTWFYRGSLNNPNGNITYVPFGMRYGDQADQVDDLYPGDFDGDGKADFRVQRRIDTSVPTSNTPGMFYTLSSSTGQITYDYFGWASDRTIPGDYDGDGKTDIAIARGFNITPNVTTWYIRYTSGIPDAAFQWGAGGLDQFAQGDYDGDGITDPTVYRRAGENNFYVLRSTDQSMYVFHWGKGDEPCGPACDVAVATYNNR